MNVPKDAMLLRILFGEEDRFEGYPLYEAIVRKARENARCWSDGLSRADGLRSLQPVAALALRSKGLAIRQIAR